METGGLFLALIGAVILFVADWQNCPVPWLAALLLLFGGLVGFTIRSWRVPLSLLLTIALVSAEWASVRLKAFQTALGATAPNLGVIAVVGFVVAYTAILMGGGIRSMVDAGRR